MKLILVDDSAIELNLLLRECSQIPNTEIAGTFTQGTDALSFVRAHRDVQLALLDIEMPGMNGIELAEELRKIRRDILIIYITAHSEFAAEAMRHKADYLVFKPYDAEDIRDAMDRASLMQKRQEKPVYAETFDGFDVTRGGSAIRFRSSKAKELMALLIVRRGGRLSIHEIVECLWNGDDTADVSTVGYRKVIKDLTDTLADCGLSDILERDRGSVRLRTEKIDSDYYRFLRGNPEAILRFQGKFLSEYPWSEEYIFPLVEAKELWLAERKRNGG